MLHCVHTKMKWKWKDRVDFILFSFASNPSRAHADGVIMDVGHGQGSFDWEIAEIATSNGFWPDVISTDLHFGSVGKEGPAKDLPHVMSKFLRLGMPMEEVSHVYFFSSNSLSDRHMIERENA